jgi:hypothetical protein
MRHQASRYGKPSLLIVALVFSACAAMTSHRSSNCSPKHVSLAAARSEQPKQLLRVEGRYLRKNGTTRICSRVIASHSPRCAGASLVVRGYEPGPHVAVHHANGAAWTSDTVRVFGHVSGTTLIQGLCV